MRNEHLSQRVFHAPALFYNKAVDKWSSLCFWWILDGNRQTYRHKSVTLLLDLQVSNNPLILSLETEKLSFFNSQFFLLKAKLISPKSIFCLISIKLAILKEHPDFSSRHEFASIFLRFFSILTYFWPSLKRTLALLTFHYWTLIIVDAWPTSFWSSNISENFGIWRRKSVTPCWSKKNYFSGKIDGKP